MNSQTRHQIGGQWPTSRYDRIIPGKENAVHPGQDVRWVPEPVAKRRIPASTRNRTQFVQPVAIQLTGWHMPAHWLISFLVAISCFPHCYFLVHTPILSSVLIKLLKIWKYINSQVLTNGIPTKFNQAGGQILRSYIHKHINCLKIGAGIAQSVQWLRYGLDDRSSQQRREFFPCYPIHTGSGAHPGTRQMGNGDSPPGGKAAGAWRRTLTSIQHRDQE
jgi:hypothetical protein